MPWKDYDTNIGAPAYEGPSPSEIERQDDENYARDFAALVAIFRTRIEKAPKPTGAQFAVELKYLANLMLEGWGASDAQFPQQCFDDWGPAILLRALAKAYEQPAHVLGELEGD